MVWEGVIVRGGLYKFTLLGNVFFWRGNGNKIFV